MRRPTVLPFRLSFLALAASALVACGGSDDDDTSTSPPATGNAIAVTTAGRVVTFDRATPGTLVSDAALSGLASGESIVGIDVRPADGLVYALTNQGRLYTLNAATGALALKSTLVADTADTTAPYAASTLATSTSFGVDFNPTVDRLRVVTDAGVNLRINVDTGATTTDGAINGAAAGVTASAYTNSFAGATTTTLYALAASGATLVVQTPPNDGTLATPLPTGLTATGASGFDVDSRTNTGYAALTVGGTTRLYTVALGTGATAAVGAIGAGTTGLVGFALARPTPPTAVVLTADNRLHAFDPAAPNTIVSTVAIGGLNASENVVGIDVRPANGRLYALTTAGRLLIVDPATGATSGAVTLVADPADTTSPYAGLAAGVPHTVDFNPVADRLRVIASTGANLRINVDTGATTTDGTINRAIGTPTVVGGAYTNSFAGTTATALYDLEANADVLALQSPPNDGTLVNVGAGLGIDLAGPSPMDIAGGENGLVLAALRAGTTGPSSLYTVSLTTGVASLYRNTGAASLSQIGGATGPTNIVDLAIRY
jgi:hypothetical protein